MHVLKGAPSVLALGVVAGVALRLVDLVGVSGAADGAAAEFQLVAGEGARLVGKDILDLAKILDEGGGAAEGGGVCLGIVHDEVRVGELCLLGLDDLHGDGSQGI